MMTLTAPELLGLPEDELAYRQRVKRVRGVFCRPGLLVPSDTTLYALVPAQLFNACLPLGPGRPFTLPGRPGAPPGVVAYWDTVALASAANLAACAPPDLRAHYVLQIELDLLLSLARSLPCDPLLDTLCDDAEAETGPAARRGAMLIEGGVNEEAITRMWLAVRDARGGFVSCDAPTGRRGEP